MGDFFSGVAVNAVGGVLAALIGPMIFFLWRRARRSRDVGTGAGRERRGDRSQIVDQSNHVDNSIHVTGSTSTVHVGKVIISQRATTFTQDSKSTRDTDSASQDDSVIPFLVFFVLGLIAAVLFYVKYREIILNTLLSSAVFTLTFTVTALIYSMLRRVSSPRGTWRVSLNAGMLGLSIVAALGCVLALAAHYLLRNPRYEHGNYDLLLTRVLNTPPVDYLGRYGWDGYRFIVFQILGLVSTFMVLLLTMTYSVGTLARMNAALGKIDNRSTSVLDAVGRRAPKGLGTPICIMGLGALSIALCSSYAYTLFDDLSKWQQDSLTTLSQPASPRVGVLASAPLTANAQNIAAVCVVGTIGGKSLTIGSVQLTRQGKGTNVWTSVGNPARLNAKGGACIRTQVTSFSHYRWAYRLNPTAKPITSNLVSVARAARA